MRGQRACSEVVCQGNGWKSHQRVGRKEGRKDIAVPPSPAWPGGLWYQVYGKSAKTICVVALVTAARPGLRKQQSSLVFPRCLTCGIFSKPIP